MTDFEKFIDLVQHGGSSKDSARDFVVDPDYDSPETFNDFLDDGTNLSLDRAAVAQQAHAIVVRRLDIPDGPVEEQKAAISNILGPGKTAQDVLCETSKFWEMRQQSADIYAQKLASLVCDSEAYARVYREYRLERIKACYAARMDSEHDVRLPNAIKVSRNWYAKRKNQFLLFPTIYPNLTYFGNIIAHMANDFTVVANPGQNFQTMFLIRITCLAAPKYNPAQSLMLLLAGDASTGKSHLIMMNKKMLPDGWTVEMSHMTTLALTDQENDDFVVLVMEETPLTMTQETAEKTGQDGGASFLKSLLTNKIVTTRSVAYDKGERKKVMHVTSKMMTGVMATNNALNASSPLLKRYLVVKPNHDPLISQKRQKVEAGDMSPEETSATEREQIVAHLVQMTEWMIGTGAIKQPDMNILPVCLNRVIVEMGNRGHAMVDAKAVNMVQEVVRTLVVLRAVCESCLSELYSELRIDANGNHKKFDDHYVEHFIHIEERLVAQEPEVYFGISICAGIFGDDTEGRLVEAARRMLGVTVKNQEIHFNTHNPPFLYNKSETLPNPDPKSPNQTIRRLVPDVMYGELMPPEGRGKDQLVNALCAQFVERPSLNNMRRAFEGLMRRGIEHKKMAIKEVNGKCVVYECSDEKACSSVIRMAMLKDNHEEVLLDEKAASKATKENARFYFCLPTFFDFKSQSDAMIEAIKSLQHRFTDRQTHLISMPLYASRNAMDFCKSEVPFYGIFETIDFVPNRDNVLSFTSHHTLSGAQVLTLTRASMLDGGDSSLRNVSKEERDARKVANERRSLAIQTPGFVVNGQLDMASYMNRYQICASPCRSPDLYHWLNFTRLCLQMRDQMPNRFGKYDLQNYPIVLLRQAQHRNKLDDLMRDSNTSATRKLQLLPSFGSHISSHSTSLIPPSEEMIIRMLATSDIEHVRGMFYQTDSRLWRAPELDPESMQLIKSAEGGEENWKTVCNIFTIYQEPAKTAAMFMRYAGYTLTLNKPPDSFRPIATIRRRDDMPAILTYKPLTIEDRISKKRQRDEERSTAVATFDNGAGGALVPRSNNNDDDNEIDSVVASIAAQNNATFFSTETLDIETLSDIDKALIESNKIEEENLKKRKLTELPQQQQQQQQSNNDDENTGTRAAPPSYSTHIDPFAQQFSFDFAR